MKKILLLTAIIFNVLIVSAQRFEWLSTSRQYNSNSNIPVATDAAGNVYTMIDIDPTLNCIIQGDTIYPVVPGTNGTIVVKYGPTGNFIWGKRIDPDGGGINGGRIVVDNAGSVYASVSFSNGGSVHLIDTVCTPSPPAYAHIIKLSSSGNFVRIKSYSNGTFISPPILACLGTDIYTGTANYLQKLDSAFNTIWNFTDPTNAIQFAHTGDSKAEIYVQANGELVVSAWEFGNTIGNIPFSDDTVHWHVGGLDEGAILKLDTSGHVLWSRTFSCDNFHPGIRAVCLDAQNNAYLGLEGYTYNAQTIFGSDTLINTRGTGDYSAILKWDSSGNPVRAIPLYPLASAPDLRELAVNAQSDLLVSGMIGSSQLYTDANDSIMGYGNFFLIKYDSAGIYKWYKTEAHNTSTFVDGIAVRYGNQYVLGGSTGTATQYQFDCIPDPTISCTNWVTVVSELPVLNPNASFTFTNVDSVYTFIDQSQNAISWHWDFGDGDTSNLQNPTHPFVTGSSYTVVLTVTNGGCTSIDTLHIIDVGIREISSPDSFSIFPNPTTGNFIITAMKSIDKVSIEVNNVLGENVFEETCFLSSKTEINLKNISAGIYFVKVYNGAKVFTQKLLIE